jgi:HEAT repeat protein
MPVLARVMEDETVADEVRGDAATAIGLIGGTEARDLLLRGLGHARARVRAFCGESLGLLGDRSLGPRLADVAAGDRPAPERAAALSALVKLGASEAHRACEKALTGSSPELRAAACSILIDHQGAAAAPRVLARLQDGAPVVRAAALAAYGRVTGKDFLRDGDDLDAAVARALAFARGRGGESAAGGPQH